MVKLSSRPRSHCPINFGLEIFGDRWTLLILRDLMINGKSSFKEFQAAEEGISSNILAERLDRLLQTGLIVSERVAADTRQIRYRPTPSGAPRASQSVQCGPARPRSGRPGPTSRSR